jgi:hypothetical protein
MMGESKPLDISSLWKYDLRQGNTDDPRNGACLFDAGMWLVYGKIGDNPPCSCPIIRAYAIHLNDSMPDDQRQLLKPFILRVVGNRDPAAEDARSHFIVLETARRIVGLSLPDDVSYAEIIQACEAAGVEPPIEALAWAAWARRVSGENWYHAIAILDGALKIGKQSPEMDEALVRKSIQAFEIARFEGQPEGTLTYE